MTWIDILGVFGIAMVLTASVIDWRQRARRDREFWERMGESKAAFKARMKAKYPDMKDEL